METSKILSHLVNSLQIQLLESWDWKNRTEAETAWQWRSLESFAMWEHRADRGDREMEQLGKTELARPGMRLRSYGGLVCTAVLALCRLLTSFPG